MNDSATTGRTRKLKKFKKNNAHDKDVREIFLFFGAGASAAGGYKTFLTFPYMFWRTPNRDGELQTNQKTYELLERIKEQLQRKGKALTLDQYLEMLDSYKSSLRNIFSDNQLREVIDQSRLSFSKAQNLNDTVERLRTNICSLTAQHYIAPPGKKEFIKLLREFVNGLMSEEFPTHVYIFTTNYDLVPEYTFSDNKSLQDYAIRCWPANDRKKNKKFWEDKCFSQGNGNPKFDFYNGFNDFRNASLGKLNHCKNIFLDSSKNKRLYWDSKSYNKGMGLKDNAVFIMRLHGCVAWIYNDVKAVKPGIEHRVCFNLSNPANIKRHFERLCVFYPGKETPIGKKPHAFAYKVMSDLALRLSALTFIGYAFRDVDVTSVVMNSLRNNHLLNPQINKNILLVNPAMAKEDFCNRIADIQNHIALPMIDTDQIDNSFLVEPLNMYFLENSDEAEKLTNKIKSIIWRK